MGLILLFMSAVICNDTIRWALSYVFRYALISQVIKTTDKGGE